MFFFIFFSAQNPLEINPLLPYVRSASNPMPFGSVDLSISSATQNNMTPSPKSQISPAPPQLTTPNPSTLSSTNAQCDANNMPPQESLALIAEMSEQLAAMKANSALATNLFTRELQQASAGNYPPNLDTNRVRPLSSILWNILILNFLFFAAIELRDADGIGERIEFP